MAHTEVHMGLSVKEAADRTGLSKAAIFKAIKTGKISAEKDLNGQWVIQPIELFRVYAPVHTNGHSQVSDGTQQSVREDTPGIQREIELLRQTVRDKDEVIADLRRRLDAAEEEKQQIMGVLTAQMKQFAEAETAKDLAFKQISKEIDSITAAVLKRPWWQRLLGGGK